MAKATSRNTASKKKKGGTTTTSRRGLRSSSASNNNKKRDEGDVEDHHHEEEEEVIADDHEQQQEEEENERTANKNRSSSKKKKQQKRKQPPPPPPEDDDDDEEEEPPLRTQLEEPLVEEAAAAAAAQAENEKTPVMANNKSTKKKKKKAPPPPPRPQAQDDDEEDDDDEGREEQQAAGPAAAAAAAAPSPARTNATTTTTTTTGAGGEEVSIYNFKPPPTKTAVTYVADMIEYLAELVLYDREHRQHHYENLKYFWGLHPAQEVEFGRLYLRVLFSEMLNDVAGISPYGIVLGEEEGGDEPQQQQREPSNTSLEYWEAGWWMDLIHSMKSLYTELKRQDATALLKGTGKRDMAKLSRKTIPQRDLHKQKFHTIWDIAHVNYVIAPIRDVLERYADYYAEHNNNGKRPRISNKEMKQIQQAGEFVDRMKNPKARESLMVLFEQNNGGDSDDSSSSDITYRLVSPAAVSQNFEIGLYDLHKFQEKLEKLLILWNGSVFGIDDPELIECNYHGALDRISVKDSSEEVAGDDDNTKKKKKSRTSTSTRQLQELRRRRERLGRNHGEDPLEESREYAARAVAASRGSASKKAKSNSNSKNNKKRARRLDISDDEIEEEESSESEYEPPRKAKKPALLAELEQDDDEDRAHLSEVPEPRPKKKKKRPNPGNWKLKPEEGIFDQHGNVIKRRKWTQEEKDALKTGVQNCGKGKWAMIKKEYPEIFRNRSSVQMKDCWRTMLKHGEVVEPPTPGKSSDGSSTQPAPAEEEEGKEEQEEGKEESQSTDVFHDATADI